MPTPVRLSDGGDATNGVEGWGSPSGTVTSSTAWSMDGARSYEFDSTASNLSALLAENTTLASLADAGRRVSVWFRFDTVPATVVIIRFGNSAGTIVFGARLRSTGKMDFVGTAGSAISTTTLAINTTYRLAVAYSISSTTVNELRLYISDAAGVLLETLTVSNLALTITGTNRLQIGWGAAPGVSMKCWFDSLYEDDGTHADGDPGNIHVTRKAPVAINTNTFDTTVGTGAVNEVPISTTNGRTQAGTGTAESTWTIQGEEVGDVNLAGCNVIGLMGWMWAAKGSTGTPTDNLTLNNVNYVAALTTSAAYYMKAVAVTAFPTNARAIGSTRTVGAAGDSLLHECGVLVAYNQGLSLGGRPDGIIGGLQMQQILAR